jgi:hypothetical protein
MAVNQRLRPGHGSEGNLSLIFIGLKGMDGPPRKDVLGWRASWRTTPRRMGALNDSFVGIGETVSYISVRAQAIKLADKLGRP